MARSVTASEVKEFYELLHRFTRSNPRFAAGVFEPNVPNAGVYFLLDPDEPHPNSSIGRIVYIGTHGIQDDTDGTLLTRLKAHQGSRRGRGGLEKSSFRSHVAQAILFQAADRARKGALEPVPLPAFDLEREVSSHIRRMNLIVVPVGDKPSEDSERAFLERQAIAFMARLPKELTHASEKWLGRSSPNPTIKKRLIWNVQHAESYWDQRLFRRLQARADGRIDSEDFHRMRHPAQSTLPVKF